MERTAIITGGTGTTLEQVRAYLPDNYTADLAPVILYYSHRDKNGYYTEQRIVIRGHDHAGWTLDGYVIPRLASGLIWAEEIQGDGANA